VPVEACGGCWEKSEPQRAASETKGAKVNSSFNRRHLRLVMVALAVAVFAAPVAQARHAPGEDPGATAPRQSLPDAASPGDSATQWNASALEIDRLGPKHVPLRHPVSRPPTSIVKVVRPAGFDWADAGIGAAAAVGFGVLLVGASALVRRRQRVTAFS
jgi:hypothetical protein